MAWRAVDAADWRGDEPGPQRLIDAPQLESCDEPLECGVSRAVIGDGHFVAWILQRQHRPDRIDDRRGFVIGGDANRHRGCELRAQRPTQRRLRSAAEVTMYLHRGQQRDRQVGHREQREVAECEITEHPQNIVYGAHDR